MKLAVGKKVHYDSGPNMTPLVDIVMVILIFLMMTGSFGGAEHFVENRAPITTPTAGGAGGGGMVDEPLDIRLDAPTGDRFIATVDRRQFSDPDALEAHLKTVLERMQAIGRKVEDIHVVIGPGRNVKTDAVLRVYDAALLAGFTKVGFKAAH